MAGPFVMGNHAGEWKFVLVHQPSCEFGSPINSPRTAVTRVLAHFDPDAIAISGAVVIGVIPLLIGREMLHRDVFVDRVVPGKPAEGTPLQRK